jgi:hypothetical protein
MLLNVPFIPGPAYGRFLNSIGRHLHSLHFSLEDPALSDARIRVRTIEEKKLVDQLKSVSGPRKYLLANGRFHSPQSYDAVGGVVNLAERMERLHAQGVLDGIVFSDAYFLFALSDAAPELAARIEAVPSVNFMIDSAQKLDTVLEIIEKSRFRPPGKITLDRLLNRRPEALSDLVAVARHRSPDIRIELLANEGCINHCPFRPTHDALIAGANAGLGVDTLRLNRDLGCMRVLPDAPHRILSSPFIRPEDQSRYEGIADIIKICGRTLGGAFLTKTVSAYVAGRYTGNLLALLDAANWMAEKWEILNEELPENYFELLSTCDQNCKNCTACRDLFRRYARSRPLFIRDLREVEPKNPD